MEDELEDNLKGKFGGADFSVPENYFEHLNKDIQTRIAVERLKALVPNPGFTVPEFYFEQLSPNILAKTQANPGLQPAKTVRLWHSDFVKYAAAACFILVAALGLYVNNQNNKQETFARETTAEQILFDIDESVIIDHIQKDQDARHATAIADQELENYILNNYSQSDIAASF